MARPLLGAQPRPPVPRCEWPLVIAHRGASSDIAEHTLPAYQKAIEIGADGLECDVRLTRDGHLVCVHDRTVNRTSNGRGVVSELDLSGLAELDFQSWRDELPGSADELLEVVPDRMAPDSARVLTLQTLLSVVADAGRPVKLLIETKHPTRYGGLVEQELVRLLRRFAFAGDPAGRPRRGVPGIEQPVTIMSFAGIALRRVRLLAPAVPLVLLLDRPSALRRTGSLPAGVHTAGPGIHALRTEPGYVARAHAAGNRVYSWTVDEPADVELARELGIDAIITNRPAQVRQQLGY